MIRLFPAIAFVYLIVAAQSWGSVSVIAQRVVRRLVPES